MAVLGRSSRLNLAEARAAVAGLASIDDLLSPAVTMRVITAGEDPRLLSLLALAGLDPTDEEGWAAVLRPSPEDDGFLRSAADRLTVMLAGVARDSLVLVTPRGWVEQYLLAAGWDPDQTHLVLYGRAMEGFFESLSPALGGTAAECRHWLAGGWIDHATAGDLRAALADSADAFDRTRAEFAEASAQETGLDASWIEATCRSGIGELDEMLASADRENVLWVIRD